MARSRSAMPFSKGSNLVLKRKLTNRSTRNISSARAPRRRCQPVFPVDFPGLLESYSDAKEIPDNLPEIPKASVRQRRISISRYYTILLKAPPQKEWKGHVGTILIIREDIRVPGESRKIIHKVFLAVVWFPRKGIVYNKI